jgi:protein-S-isoprenylcysteine O-methyltransferase Ste14
MNAYRIRSLNFPWPPFYYFTALALAFAADRFAPLALADGHASILQAGGFMLLAIGIGLDFWALVTMLSHHTPVLPFRSAAHLVICGPFRLTRNPIYLGYTLSCLGIGLLMNDLWFMLGGLFAAMLTHMVAIHREEQHLLARFGYEYERYCRRTRAWI